MKEYTYTNKAYLGIKEGIVPPAPQYLWLNSKDNKLYKFGDNGWEPIRDEVLKGFTAEQIEEILNSIENKVDKEPGKGLSTNDYSNEEKEQVAKNTSDIATNAEKIAEQGAMLSKHGEDIAKNAEDIAKKANTTEYYPSMAVGVADNLRGRGEATEEYFTYRPSAGASNSISEEGVATMKRIKGNSLVWNQKVNLSEKVYTENGVTATINNSGISLSGVAANSHIANTSYVCVYQHKYLMIARFINNPNNLPFSVAPFNIGTAISINNTSSTNYIFYTQTSERNYCNIGVRNFGGSGVDLTGISYLATVYDLTLMFGAGNEPTTIEEFYARIPEGIDINAYNEGQLISMNANAIETTGFNQFNGEYAEVLPHNTYYLSGEYTSIGFAEELGGTTEEIVLAKDRLYTPATKGYIYASGANININLSHSGVRDGEYEPYKESIKDLSVIQKYFPNGMRSAGSVYDEITETEAIRRIGEVDLGSLNWGRHNYGDESDPKYTFRTYSINDGIALKGWVKSNILASQYNLEIGGNVQNVNLSYGVEYVSGAAKCLLKVRDDSYTDAESFKSAMSGVKLYYELAEPIVTPIITRDINLNYPVWDWGTERAVSDAPSAPFRADIIYGFNAVDTIRTNKLNIEDILRRLAELEAKTVVEQSVEE